MEKEFEVRIYPKTSDSRPRRLFHNLIDSRRCVHLNT